MPLSDGDPAESWDVWMRVITNGNYWKKDGTLHNSAFKGKGALSTSEESRPWSHELSGRLLSLINDVQQESADFCRAHNKDFHGIMYQTVENLRAEVHGFPTDVRYTPKSTDPAHGDFVTFNTTDADLPAIRDWLQDFIKALKPDNVAAICALRRK
jgi:hypothetical protein